MSKPVPANGKFFTKEELLKHTPENDVEGRAFIQCMHDHIDKAPIEALLVVVANRLAAIKGEEVSCEQAAFIGEATDRIGNNGMTLFKEHALTHVDEFIEEMIGPGLPADLKQSIANHLRNDMKDDPGTTKQFRHVLRTVRDRQDRDHDPREDFANSLRDLFRGVDPNERKH